MTFKVYYSRIERLALGNVKKIKKRQSNLQQIQLKKGRLESEMLRKVPCACAVICGIHYWGQNMTFLEASQLGGICSTAYPADCRRRHTPLAFYKTPSLSPCRFLHTAVIVYRGNSAGKYTMRSIHYSPGTMYFVLVLNYTMQIRKAKERKVCKEQT